MQDHSKTDKCYKVNPNFADKDNTACQRWEKWITYEWCKTSKQLPVKICVCVSACAKSILDRLK